MGGDEQRIVGWIAAEPVDVDDAGIARCRGLRRLIFGFTAAENKQQRGGRCSDRPGPHV